MRIFLFICFFILSACIIEKKNSPKTVVPKFFYVPPNIQAFTFHGPIRDKFLKRTPWTDSQTQLQRKTQPPLVRYTLRRHNWEIDGHQKLKDMFWRRSFSDVIAAETADNTQKLEQIIAHKKDLINTEVNFNKRFMAPYPNQLLSGAPKDGFMKSVVRLLKRKFPSLFYPGMESAMSYYDYDPEVRQPHSRNFGVKHRYALPWFPRYHRTYKTYVAPYTASYPEKARLYRTSPYDDSLFGVMSRQQYPERGDSDYLFWGGNTLLTQLIG